MPDRITEQNLERAVNNLNDTLGLPRGPTCKDAAGRIKFVEGAFGIDSAYGGYKLIQYVSDSGAEVDVTYSRQSKRDLYNTIHAIMNAVWRAKNWRKS